MIRILKSRQAAQRHSVVARVASTRALCAVRRSCRTHLRHQAASQQVEIGQRKGRKQARGVLGQPAIADFREAPEPLDDVKGMLAAEALPLITPDECAAYVRHCRYGVPTRSWKRSRSLLKLGCLRAS